MLIQHSVNSDWLSNTETRVLQADWLDAENNEPNEEKATLNLTCPIDKRHIKHKTSLSISSILPQFVFKKTVQLQHRIKMIRMDLTEQ